MESLASIPKEQLRATLKARELYKYDQAEYLIDQAEFLLPVTIGDERIFQNLIAATYVLEDGERPRTLHAIASRILKEYGNLDGLIAAHPCHKPEWYVRLKNLVEGFKWQHVGPVFVTPVKGSRKNGRNEGDELPNSPSASFFIVSGLHCSLAAMLTVLRGTDRFQPVEAILVLPRIDYP